MLQGHGEIPETVLDQGTIPVVAEPFEVTGGGLEIEEQEDPILSLGVVILSQEDAPQVAGANIAVHLLQKLEH
jgi:hypothetical protein